MNAKEVFSCPCCGNVFEERGLLDLAGIGPSQTTCTHCGTKMKTPWVPWAEASSIRRAIHIAQKAFLPAVAPIILVALVSQGAIKGEMVGVAAVIGLVLGGITSVIAYGVQDGFISDEVIGKAMLWIVFWIPLGGIVGLLLWLNVPKLFVAKSPNGYTETSQRSFARSLEEAELRSGTLGFEDLERRFGEPTLVEVTASGCEVSWMDLCRATYSKDIRKGSHSRIDPLAFAIQAPLRASFDGIELGTGWTDSLAEELTEGGLGRWTRTSHLDSSGENSMISRAFENLDEYQGPFWVLQVWTKHGGVEQITLKPHPQGIDASSRFANEIGDISLANRSLSFQYLEQILGPPEEDIEVHKGKSHVSWPCFSANFPGDVRESPETRPEWFLIREPFRGSFDGIRLGSIWASIETGKDWTQGKIWARSPKLDQTRGALMGSDFDFSEVKLTGHAFAHRTDQVDLNWILWIWVDEPGRIREISLEHQSQGASTNR